MNKKILISLGIIGVVAAVAIGGTIAYFSDTETSTGNTFTAGELDLTIDNECYYSDGVQWGGDGDGECTWSPTNLDGQFFFNFEDLKPGDWGEDTVSIHVDNNDAWACVTIDNLSSDDNSCTEPEEEAEEGNCGGVGEGELAENLFFGFWLDMCDDEARDAAPGDNIFTFDCEGDVDLMWGYADEILPDGAVYTLADSGENNVGGEVGEPLYLSNDYYIGKVWCYGEPVDYDPVTGLLVCDGLEVGNESQTDSLSGDITFYAEQARNNEGFTCASWDAGPSD